MAIKRVVIVGGGTAGWISAAVLMRVLGRVVDITLVESDDIGTVGVGEATIPPILSLNRALGIDEADFLRATKGTIKLGIEFENWGDVGERYMHAFGSIGKDYPFCTFHHLWTRYRQFQPDTDFWDFSLNYQAAKASRYAPLERMGNSDLQGLVHAYHFDAGLYARYLRDLSERGGVTRLEGRVVSAAVAPDSGDIKSVTLADGRCVEGDLFIDCSGFRGLLISQRLHVGYDDWSHWLPCNRALAVQTTGVGAPVPYTRSIAHDAGWRWQIPLQHRVGNGLVYSDAYLDDQQAHDRLLSAVEGDLVSDPRPIHFRTGRRRQQWSKNCVSIGLASGFLEPLESTSIHLIQTGILRLVKLFPHTGIKQADVDEYNRQSRAEFEHIRDFIILHYKATRRSDSDFWRYCAGMQVPDSLAHKMALFEETGNVYNPTEDLFSDIAWQQVLIGQGVVPRDYHPLATTLDSSQLEKLATNLRNLIGSAVATLPSHEEWLQRVIATPEQAIRRHG